MEIKVIGCSTTWTNRPTSSYAINNNLLVDCGEGTYKFYKKAKVDFLSIKHIFITHFHGDHTMALGTYLNQYLVYKPNSSKQLSIYGPKGLKECLEHIYSLAVSKNTIKIEDCINIVEIEDVTKPIQIDNLTINITKLNHNEVTDYAYTICDEHVKVGFSGDCTMCDEVYDFIEKSDVCFLDCCGKTTSANHLGLNDYKTLEQKYQNKKFFAIHCNDDIYKNAKKLKIKVAKHGKKYVF